MFFSVIIPTCNRPDLLRLCLKHITPDEQCLSTSFYEVIVTDDSNDLRTKEMLTQDFPWVNYTKGPCKGPASNRNNGASNAEGAWLVFLDDDCIPDKILLKAYSDSIKKNPDIKVFEGKIYADRPQKRFDEIAPINLQGGYLWSCNFCINKSVFDSLKGFDEDYPYASMEDMDFYKRLMKKDVSVLFVKNASVCHPWRKRKGGDWRKKHRNSLNIYLTKHPEERKRIDWQYRIRLLKNGVFFIIRNIIPYRGKGISVYWKELMYNCFNFS